MKIKNYTEEIEMPDGITISQDGKEISLKGPKGEATRTLYSPAIGMKVEGNKVILSVETMTKREKALVGTYRAHIKNLIKGVTEGHVYKLKICSGHFPMNVSYNNNVLSIKNFIGEKIPRELTVRKEVSLKIEGEVIVIESANKELAGNTAGAVEKLTRRPNFDKRIFQDGIYIIEKDGKTIE